MSELIPTGSYDDVEILDHGFDESGQKKTLFFWVKFRIPEHGEILGRFYLPKGSDKGLEAAFKKIEAMGFSGDDLTELADGSLLVGNLVQITIEHEVYEGVTRARVGFVNPNHSTGNGPAKNEVAAANAKGFNAIWRKGKGKRAQAATDADVPF